MTARLDGDDLRALSLALGERVAVLQMPVLADAGGAVAHTDPDGQYAAYALEGRVGLWTHGLLTPAQALDLAAGLAALAARQLAGRGAP